MEVFDWLRGLEDGHDLVCLCDVYTYTTMISQCGSHQQLRRALELVAEMRGRGVACNVHTYSALMNVCIKANELDLALDVYRQLLSDSCTPNLVTYNTLIDVYGKTGQWEEAVKVLDALEHQVTVLLYFPCVYGIIVQLGVLLQTLRQHSSLKNCCSPVVTLRAVASDGSSI